MKQQSRAIIDEEKTGLSPRARCRPLALVLLIPLALCAQATKSGRGDFAGQSGAPAPPAADLAALEGQVFNVVGGTPLRKATIIMNRMDTASTAPGTKGNYSATTDASGRYSITGIEPGTYRLSANRTGFLNMQYNARRPETAGTALDLRHGEKKTGVDFRLTPNGVITGKITDEEGDPMQGVQIQLLLQVYNRGKKQLQMSSGSASNDVGEFRLSGISPGRYYIAATYRSPDMMLSISLNFAGTAGEKATAREDWVTTFFPNATDVSAASPLNMGPGDQIEGINIKLSTAHTVWVSGHVIDNTSFQSASPAAPPDGARRDFVVAGGQSANPSTAALAAPRIQILLQARNPLGGDRFVNNAQVRTDGSFEFPSVAPGAYYLIAVANPGVGAHTARRALEVGGSNLEGINLVINPGATVSGHVHYDGDSPSLLPSLSISLTPRERNLGAPAPQSAKSDAEGNFRFEDVNRDIYDVKIDTPPNLYTKSLRAGSADVMISGLDLTSGAATLNVLMGANPPQVAGLVLNETTGQPAPAITVALIPREKERQGESYFYSATNSDQYGNFNFSRVTPGQYEIYAWEDVTYGQWFDPEWMKTYKGRGEALEAKEGSLVNVKLTMIPAK